MKCEIVNVTRIERQLEGQRMMEDGGDDGEDKNG